MGIKSWVITKLYNIALVPLESCTISIKSCTYSTYELIKSNAIYKKSISGDNNVRRIKGKSSARNKRISIL